SAVSYSSIPRFSIKTNGGFAVRLNGGVKGLAHSAEPRIYRSILIEEENGARQRLRSRRDERQGRRQAERDTHQNATRSATRHSRRRSLHDHHPRLPPPTPWPWSDLFVWLGMRSGTGIQS